MRPLVVLAVVIAVVFQLGLRYLPFGRRLFAIGSNPDAARRSPASRSSATSSSAFVLSGALAGLAGFMFLARFGNITVTAGQGLELQVVAAVVVGGVNIFGGVGSIIGALLGATLIDLLQQSLIRWLEVSEFVRDAILGLLILLAVASDKVILGRLRTLWVRARTAATQAAPRRRRDGVATVARELARRLRSLGRAAARHPARGPGPQRHRRARLPDGPEPGQPVPARASRRRSSSWS